MCIRDRYCRHRCRVRGQFLAGRESEGYDLQLLVVEQSSAQNAIFRYGNLRLDVLQESIRCHILIVTARERASHLKNTVEENQSRRFPVPRPATRIDLAESCDRRPET